LLQQIAARTSRLRTIVLVPAGASDLLAATAVEAGAWDVWSEDQPGTALLERSACAARLHRLHPARTETVGAETEDDSEEPLQMVGTSPAIREIFGLIRRVAASDVPVLILGESGTGKELAALAIHERSQRAEKPFVPINCSAIADNLLEA